MTASACVLLAAPEALAGLFLDRDDPANREVVEVTAGLFVIAALYSKSSTACRRLPRAPCAA